MKVRVVAITKPVIEEAKTAEEFIAYAAKVSNPAKQDDLTSAPKLMKYLVDNQHWSPFEMAHVVMEIETTRDIARQILRHRSFAFQEFSQRYANATALGDFVIRQARLQDKKNRQNSVALDMTDDYQGGLSDRWNLLQERVIKEISWIYQWALDNGIAKEQARAILPEGLTPSRLYMSGSVRSWVHYCQLRMANGTQQEHMDIAKACYEELRKHFPAVCS